MATTRSSRAITSTRTALLGGVAAAAAALTGSTVAAPPPGAQQTSPPLAPQKPPSPEAAAKPLPQGQGSFFDPLDRVDPARWYVSDGWTNGDYQGCAWSRDNVGVSRGVLQLRLGRANDKLRPYRCGEIKTNAPHGYGTYEARIRTAAGSGLNTAMFTYSGYPLSTIHDEIDFEFLGRNSGQVQLNYFTKGDGKHASHPELGFDAAAGFNDYAFVWRPDGVRWYINGKLVREASGAGLPTTPGSLFLSLWNGTDQVKDWLGPFDTSRTPVVAEVDWIAYTKTGERCRFPQSITCKLP